MSSLFDRLLTTASTASPVSTPPPSSPPPTPPSVAALFPLERARLLSTLPPCTSATKPLRPASASPFSVYTPPRPRAVRCTARCLACRADRQRLRPPQPKRRAYSLRGLTCPHCGRRGFVNRDAVLKHVTTVALRGPGRETLARRPRLLNAFWAGILAVREKSWGMSAQVVAVAVKREYGVKKFDIRPVYPSRVVLTKPSWMSVDNVAKAFPQVRRWQRGRKVAACEGAQRMERFDGGAGRGNGGRVENAQVGVALLPDSGRAAGAMRQWELQTSLNASAVRVVSPRVHVLPRAADAKDVHVVSLS